MLKRSAFHTFHDRGQLETNSKCCPIKLNYTDWKLVVLKGRLGYSASPMSVCQTVHSIAA